MCKTQYKEATAHHAKLAVAASMYCGRPISAGMIRSWCDAALEPACSFVFLILTVHIEIRMKNGGSKSKWEAFLANVENGSER